MTGPVAIATENDDFDGEVYRLLLELLLGDSVERWKTETRFSGWTSIEKRLGLYLENASADGITRCLIAVDNDGGAKRHPEHLAGHDQAVEAENREGCCECWLRSVVPASWIANGGQTCVVVPVQTVETWLLCVRGEPPLTSPEASYDRRVLKRLFFGKPTPPVDKRTELALAEIRKPNALDVLRARPSFQRFEAQVAAFRT